MNKRKNSQQLSILLIFALLFSSLAPLNMGFAESTTSGGADLMSIPATGGEYQATPALLTRDVSYKGKPSFSSSSLSTNTWEKASNISDGGTNAISSAGTGNINSILVSGSEMAILLRTLCMR